MLILGVDIVRSWIEIACPIDAFDVIFGMWQTCDKVKKQRDGGVPVLIKRVFVNCLAF